MLRHAVAVELLRRVHALEREQDFALLGDEADALTGLAAGPREDIEQIRRQTFVQRAAAGRLDMHAIALDAIGAGAVALIDGDADDVFLEALRQREPADAAADDDDVKRPLQRGGHGLRDGGIVWMCGHCLFSVADKQNCAFAPLTALARLASRRSGW